MSQSIGTVNTEIVRALDLHYVVKNLFTGVLSRGCGETEESQRNAAIDLIGNVRGGLQYCKLACEMHHVTIEDLKRNDWKVFRGLVESWAIPKYKKESKEMMLWLHKKYNFPKEAAASASHNAMFLAVEFESVEIACWLVDNFGERLEDAMIYLEEAKKTIIEDKDEIVDVDGALREWKGAHVRTNEKIRDMREKIARFAF